MRIEVRIDRLVVDDQVRCSPDQIAAAVSRQLRPSLGRVAAASAGRAVGAAIARTTTSPRGRRER